MKNNINDKKFESDLIGKSFEDEDIEVIRQKMGESDRKITSEIGKITIGAAVTFVASVTVVLAIN
ncbi:MAG: hypothetical protein FWG67_03150 [Defluviitaleaceae bacterium]|nr:hypothetical protein [Defluviitaleaceae bacterium]